MITIKMPKEIKSYESKFLLGMTMRQFLSLSVAGVIAFFLVPFLSNFFAQDMAVFITILICLPILAVGFLKIDGMTVEDFLPAYLQDNFLSTTKRIYEADNFHEKLLRKYEDVDINLDSNEDSKKKKKKRKKKKNDKNNKKGMPDLKDKKKVYKFLKKENKKNDNKLYP